jgi:FixJ family two-component response regulator
MAQLTVYVIDDDDAARESLAWLIQSGGYTVRTCRSADEFLHQSGTTDVGCLIVDYRMPGMTGLELFERLHRSGHHVPTIFVTAYGKVEICSRAFRGGAVDFLEKPIKDEVLLAQVAKAMRGSQVRQEVEERFSLLSPREQEVMWLLVRGQNLKQIASTLGISVQTAAKHRSRVLEKLEVQNDVELSRRARMLPFFPNERLTGDVSAAV